MEHKKIIDDYRSYRNIKVVARHFGISAQKVKKILLTYGEFESDRTTIVGKLYNSGKSQQEIAELLKISVKGVNANLPYLKGEYNSENASKNALNIRKCRAKNK